MRTQKKGTFKKSSSRSLTSLDHKTSFNLETSNEVIADHPWFSNSSKQLQFQDPLDVQAIVEGPTQTPHLRYEKSPRIPCVFWDSDRILGMVWRTTDIYQTYQINHQEYARQRCRYKQELILLFVFFYTFFFNLLDIFLLSLYTYIYR